MNNHAIVRIRWYKENEGGRKNLPEGSIYGANLRFSDEDNLWSIVLHLGESFPNEEGYQNIRISFLFRDNVGERLQSGKRIFILEGPKRIIADGYVISVTNQ